MATTDQSGDLGFLPLDQIQTVIGYFRGDTGTSWIDAAKAACDVIQFGLELLSNQPQSMAATAAPVTEEQAIGHLEDIVKAEEAQQPRAVDGSIWAALLPVLGQMLATWLAKRGQRG